MYVMAILYEVLVPLSTAILIIINEPPGMARLSVRLAYTVTSKRRDAAHIHAVTRDVCMYNAATSAKNRSNFDYRCPEFNVGT